MVDSPPGITSASTASNSPRRRTVDASAPASRSAARCSRVSPCNASTPTRGALILVLCRCVVALVAGEPFLHDGRNHLAVLVVDLALRQRAPTARGRGRLVIEQPFIGTKCPHEPHRVIQRRDMQMLALFLVIDLRRAQQREVAHIGQRADVQHMSRRAMDLDGGTTPAAGKPCQGGVPAFPVARREHPTRRTGGIPRRRTPSSTCIPGRSSGGGACGIASWCSMPVWSV